MKNKSFKCNFLLAIILLSICCGCASSRRLSRTASSILNHRDNTKQSSLRDYQPPQSRADRSEYFRKDSKTLPTEEWSSPSRADSEHINLWPLFYHAGDYTSVIWPIFDFDSYGLSIRPIYNLEENEHSFIFPLSSWNTEEKSGWFVPSWWNFEGDRSEFHFFPLGGFCNTPSRNFFWITSFYSESSTYREHITNRERGSYRFGLFPIFGVSNEEAYFKWTVLCEIIATYHERLMYNKAAYCKVFASNRDEARTCTFYLPPLLSYFNRGAELTKDNRIYYSYDGATFPLYSYYTNHETKEFSWKSLALITQYESRGDEYLNFKSLPLFTYIYRDKEEDTTSVLGPIIWHSTRTRDLRRNKHVFSHNEKRGSKLGMVEYENDYGFLGLYYHGRDYFQVARDGYSEHDINAIRDNLRGLVRERAILRDKKTKLSEEEAELASREGKTKIENYQNLIEIEKLGEKNKQWEIDAKHLNNLWGKLQEAAKKINFSLPEKLPEAEDEVDLILDKLVEEKSELRCFEDYGNAILWRREKFSNGDYSWHILRWLANGKQDGASEEIKFLHFLYRSYQFEKDNVIHKEKDIFPFISIREEGDDVQYSFLWRLFNYKKEGNKSHLHLFFIPVL